MVKKVKLLLTLISILIFVIPVGATVFMYKDNLIGLIIPPEVNQMVNDMTSGDGDGGLPIDLPKITKEPEYNFNADTNTATLSFEVENTMDVPLSFDEFSANIVYNGDNSWLGSINIDQPITIQPGESGIVSILGNIPQETIDNFIEQHSGMTEEQILNSLSDYSLTDVDINIGGIVVHFDKLTPGDIQGLLGGS